MTQTPEPKLDDTFKMLVLVVLVAALTCMVFAFGYISGLESARAAQAQENTNAD